MVSSIIEGDGEPKEIQTESRIVSDDDADTSEAEYPSVLIRTIIVASLMLAVFLVR